MPPRKRFEELLRAHTDRPARKPPAPPRRQRAAAPARPPGIERRVALAAGTLRGQARKEMDASARQRMSDGTVATAQATGRLEARAAELLHAALRTEAASWAEAPTVAADSSRPAPGGLAPVLPTGPGVAPAGIAGSGAGAPRSTSEERVERALALVERIERFVRSGRPSLALTLRGGLPGELELQRVAPGAIAIRLASPRPPSARELGELRQALEARGLSVQSLETRGLRASGAGACSPCP
ncbi:MAG TPA: hypothetical protein VMT11_03855 [Myxococcaceae bacterium]|nr:hypothetical protein [Myxococcaceae bacterium]